MEKHNIEFFYDVLPGQFFAENVLHHHEFYNDNPHHRNGLTLNEFIRYEFDRSDEYFRTREFN
jgi:hypothetical protein